MKKTDVDTITAAKKVLLKANQKYQKTKRESLRKLERIARRYDDSTQTWINEFVEKLSPGTPIPRDILNIENIETIERFRDEFTNRLRNTINIYEELKIAGWVSKLTSFISRKFFGQALRLRDNVKINLPMLYAKGEVRDTDEHFEAILRADVELICCVLGISAAFNIFYKNKIHNASNCNFIMLSRHEVCTNITKAFGLRPDTDLTALAPFWFQMNIQSTLELYAAKIVKETVVQFINLMYNTAFPVHVISSPVSRAISTAIHAGLRPDIVCQFHISNHFSESKFSARHPRLAFFSRFATSGTERKTPEELKARLLRHGYKNITATPYTREDSIRSVSETCEDYAIRILAAAEELKSRIRLESGVIFVFAHAAFLMSLESKLTQKKPTKLMYGQTAFFCATHKEGEVLPLGIMDRFGRIVQ